MSKLAKKNEKKQIGSKKSKKLKSSSRIEKKTNGIKKKSNKFKAKGQKARDKAGKSKNSLDIDAEEDTIKKKPSKAQLKLVIEKLQKDATLLVVRKALKYIPFYLKSEGLIKKLLKEIIRLWAEASEKVRVICLLCLIRIYTKLKDKERKQDLIKKLYNSFLDKCRVTKHETMSMIGFMRHSLIELYKLDPNIAFKQAQTACQQLTLTLKNADSHKNEETYKTVLNWQFANCLILLSNLVISQEDDSPVKTLTQQVIKLNLGAINFLTSPRYFPFYCHLIENLIGLSSSTRLFIPILPLMMSIIEKIQVPLEKKKKKKIDKKSNGLNHKNKLDKKKTNKFTKRKHSDDEEEEDDEESDSEEVNVEESDEESEKQIVKEYNMELLNHVSLDEAHCKEYQFAVLDKVYELIVRYLASQCHRIAFPELVLLPLVQLKKWLKRNPGQQAQTFQTLYDKIKTDCNLIENERKSVAFEFTNYAAVDAWEKKMKDSNKLNLMKMLEAIERNKADKLI